MVAHYDISARVDSLLPVMERYTEWFNHIFIVLSYPQARKTADKHQEPRVFDRWMKSVEQMGLTDGVIRQLERLHEDLMTLTREVLKEALQTDEPAPFDEFKRITVLFEEFIQSVRRLEHQYLLNDYGLDALTGLRSGSLLGKDYQRELDRLSRQGKSFCMALIRIDSLVSIREQGKNESANACLQFIADLIKQCIRSFDDAYRLQGDEFLLMLKQTDILGGVRAIERLGQTLSLSDFTLDINGEMKHPTLSSCIAEPVPGDDLDDVINNLMSDLKSIGQDKNSVLEYYELSPLERYAKDIRT